MGNGSNYHRRLEVGISVDQGVQANRVIDLDSSVNRVIDQTVTT